MIPIKFIRAYKYVLVSVFTWLLCDSGLAYGLEFDRFFKRPDQRAIEMLESGQVEAAASEFTDPKWRGVSRYKAGLYQQAMEDFILSEDANSLYNHGTAAARAGDYTQSVASLEKALELAPQDANIAHNLEVARKLKDLAEQQQDQNQDNQDQDNQDQDQDQDQESESEENSDDAESEQQSESQESEESQQGDESEQSESNSDSQSDNDSQSEPQENSGEMSEQEQDQASDSQDQAAEDLRDMMQQEQTSPEQEDQPNEQQAEQQMPASQPESVSEDDQATEQWLRRIPDDASQLLRNKIRLNHLIEYPQVNDMQEPW